VCVNSLIYIFLEFNEMRLQGFSGFIKNQVIIIIIIIMRTFV